MMDRIITEASTYAGDLDRLILVITLLTGVWLFAAEAVLFYFIFKYRRRPGVKALYVTGEEQHARKFISIPHNLVLVCDVVIIAMAAAVWYTIKQNLPPADETIRVIGQQWAWRFVHPGLDHQPGTEDDVETVDELHVKVNTLYHFKLESEDVIHSFSVPVFRLKQDAIPGRIITGWFKPTKTGTFDVQCAEICGIGHGVMVSKIIIESAADHEAWLRAQHKNG